MNYISSKQLNQGFKVFGHQLECDHSWPITSANDPWTIYKWKKCTSNNVTLIIYFNEERGFYITVYTTWPEYVSYESGYCSFDLSEATEKLRMQMGPQEFKRLIGSTTELP